jgi:hypothetical protein
MAEGNTGELAYGIFAQSFGSPMAAVKRVWLQMRPTDSRELIPEPSQESRQCGGLKHGFDEKTAGGNGAEI